MSSVFHRSRTGFRKAGDCSAIFVHAGAGYHSVQNEAIHLQACNDAAVAAMAMLRSGGSAVDAVEMAIKVLEDREITNAGYGSNLSINGTVEGDAVVVDHLGRSGGCGAVPNIKNPISLARTILDLSTQELSLRRVPPNLLTGEGAREFAVENGIAVVTNDSLVSPSAKERWMRWKADLKNADKKARQHQDRQQDTSMTATPSDPPPDYDEHVRSQLKRDHTKARKAAVWNEGQPTSPLPTVVATASHNPDDAAPSASSSVSSRLSGMGLLTPNSDAEDRSGGFQPLTADNLARNARLRDPTPSTSGAEAHFANATRDAAGDSRDWSRVSTSSGHDRHLGRSSTSDALEEVDENMAQWQSGDYLEGTSHDRGAVSEGGTSSPSTLRLPSLTPSPPLTSSEPVESHVLHREDTEQPRAQDYQEAKSDPKDSPLGDDVDDDMIIDTVGAIAIDSEGRIACGASSGGIGMKFRGRTGPAALVGVGAAVVPCDAHDKHRMTTAAVTSGTGEHMATTLAANVCADRLYHNLRRRKAGPGFEEAEDDLAVRSMIEDDFMGHSSVKGSHSSGAIGVLAVKKTAHGAYLYFAHNTDSFALASMSTDEPKPTCTMSRSHGNGMLAQGGRSIRYKRRW